MCDPPWHEHGGGKIKRGADRHYELLKMDEIIDVISNCAYWNPHPDGCHLFLWVTNNFLEDGLLVMRELGFRYVTNRCWAKDRIGLGYYFRGQHELCLFGVMGKLPPLVRNISSLIVEPKTIHSRKPQSFFDDLERGTHEPRLEMFAREKRDGWIQWGLEI